MNVYADTLAPWEEKNAYYRGVKLGRGVNELKRILKSKTDEMIVAQIDSVDEIVSNQDVSDDAVQEIGYGIKDIGQGMSGLKAAFEWGISDVVWCVEKETEELKNVMMNIYKVPGGKMDRFRHIADDAFARGDMTGAMEMFEEVESLITDDFSISISYGIIYLFHKIDKNEALVYFDKAIKYARPHSTYYTSYALLYKALIKRDFGLVEEAEQCTREAIELSPGFAEAMYQNAHYNALLNRPEKAIPLLKKAIKTDLVYCLKILGEQDFQSIGSQIAELFEGVWKEKNEKVTESLEEVKKGVVKLTSVVKGVEKLGYDVSRESSVELLENGSNEIDSLIKNNSILDAHFAGTLIPFLSKKLKRQTGLLRRKGNELNIKLDRELQDLSAGMAGKKKKNNTLPFLIQFLFGQIIALPFGWYIGIPLGICITEALLVTICIYVNVIQPQFQWKDINAKQKEQDKLLSIIREL